PPPGTEAFTHLVWGKASGRENPVFSSRGEPPSDLGAHLPDWLQGGTTLVLRDIAMNLETWDEADRPGREFAIGRTVGSGAPLSGGTEFTDPDFKAVDKRGLTKISSAS
ncbi:peroxidase, partial [Burkholderia multivorans]